MYNFIAKKLDMYVTIFYMVVDIYFSNQKFLKQGNVLSTYFG